MSVAIITTEILVDPEYPVGVPTRYPALFSVTPVGNVLPACKVYVNVLSLLATNDTFAVELFCKLIAAVVQVGTPEYRTALNFCIPTSVGVKIIIATLPALAAGHTAVIWVELTNVFVARVLLIYTALFATNPVPVIRILPPLVLTAFALVTELFASRYAMFAITGPALTVVVVAALVCPAVVTPKLIEVLDLIDAPTAEKPLGVLTTTD
jgi:hypothetical protein